MSQDQSIEESLEIFISAFTNSINTALTGTIVKIRENQKIDVLPTVTRSKETDGEIKVLDYSIIPNVPVFILGSADFFASFPIKVGDPVLLLFIQHSIDKYVISDGKEKIDSLDTRHHDLNDAIAIAGNISPMNKISAISDTDFVVGKKDGSTLLSITPDNQIIFKANKVLNGNKNANIALAKADKVDARLSALESYVVVPHGSPAGPTIPTPFLPGAGGASTASTTVFTDK